MKKHLLLIKTLLFALLLFHNGVNAQYCSATYSTGCQWGDGITSFQLGSISIPSITCTGSPNIYYHDFTSSSTDLVIGNAYTITISGGYSNTNTSVWIDYDHNSNFDGAGENVGGVNCVTAGSNYAITFTVPVTASTGSTRLRIRTSWNTVPVGPCSSEYYGNCCDFSVNLISGGAASTVTTLAATNMGATSATLNGNVNANGSATTVSFDYGTTLAYGTSIAAEPNTVNGNNNTPVSKALSGLAPNTTYHYRVSGHNSGGTTLGMDMTFTTSSAPPTATTQTATNAASTTVTLNGTVNANNLSTSISFEYGLNTSYGSTVSGSPMNVTGSTDIAITGSITGLSANTTYHYRIVATNSSGTTSGDDMTFTTTPTLVLYALPLTESSWATIPPTGWTKIGYTWVTSNSAMAGGVSPELRANYSGSADNDKMFTPPLNTAGLPYLVLRFKYLLDDYGPGCTLRVQSSSDGVIWTNESWSRATINNANYGPFDIVTTINSNLAGGVTYVAFTLTGTTSMIDNWYIDNVRISAPEPPTVITSSVSSVWNTGAVLGGIVVDDAANAVTARGVCLSTMPNPTLMDFITNDGSGLGSFTSNISPLTPGTTYHYRAYAVNDIGTSYGADSTFTTPGATVFNVTGGGSYCTGGTGLGVGLDGSEMDVNYILYRGNVMVDGSTQMGTGAALTWDNQSAGTYTVKASAMGNLIVMSGSAVITSSSNAVSVSISASANSTCTGTGVTYTATPVNGGAAPLYLWKVNDIGVGFNSNQYIYTPNNGDQIKCVLTSNISCPSGNPATSNIVTATVEANPVPTITGPASVCGIPSAGNSYTTEAGKTNYIWTISDGGTITAGTGTRTITISWTNTGAHSVNVGYSTSIGCAAVAPTSYAVNVYPFVASTIDGTASICGIPSAGNVYSTVAGMSGYVWTVSQGGTITGGQGTNAVTVTWTSVGARTLTVTYSDGNGCSPSSPIFKNVNVYALPVPTIAGSASICGIPSEGNVYTTEAGMSGYSWNVSAGGVITAGAGTRSITVTWNAVGNKTVDVIYTETHQCTAGVPTVKNVSVNQYLPVSIGIVVSANPVCAGSVVTFTANPTNGGASPTYHWKVNGANVGGNSFTYSYIPLNNDLVSCVLNSSLPCPSDNPATSDTIAMVVNPRPAAPVSGGDQTACSNALPGLLSVLVPQGVIVDWYNATQGGNLLQANSVNYNTNIAGNYYAESIDAVTGCKSTTRTLVKLTINIAVQYFMDFDGDGFGNPNISVMACDQPLGFVANALDCDDNNGNINPVAQTFNFTGNPGFVNSIVSPTEGTPSTLFHFEADYFDPTNAMPPAGYPRLMLDYEGNGCYVDANDRIVLMTAEQPQDITTNNGKRYFAEVNGLAYGTSWKARIISSAGENCTTSFGPFNVPDVLHEPNLYVFANDITITPSGFHPISSNLTISAVVHNESDFAAQNFDCKLTNQWDPTIVYPPIHVANLAAHQTTTIQFNIVTPEVPAWCPMQVWVDCNDIIKEINELDNSAVRPFTNGNYQVAGEIVVESAVSPQVSYSAQYSYLRLSGSAHYEDIAVPLLDPSVAGATVEYHIVELPGQTYSCYNNSWGQFSMYFPAPIAPGVYHIEGTVTDFTLTGNFTNEFTILAPIIPETRPNLTLNYCHSVDVTPVNPDNPALGGLINLVAHVLNNGNATAVGTPLNPIEVRFTYSTGQIWTVPFVGNIAPGQTVAIRQLNANLPVPGTMLTALVDPQNFVAEWNETNLDNSSTDEMNYEFEPVGVCGADFWGNRCSSETSADIYVGVNVRHLYDANPVQVLFEVSGPGLPPGWNFQGMGVLNNATRNCYCPYVVTSPNPYVFNVPGLFTFRMTVDPNNVYGESNENNNILIKTVTVTQCVNINPVTKPNLTLNYCHSVDVQPVNPDNPALGGNVTLVAHVTNNGNAVAVAPIEVLFSYDGVPPPAGPFLGWSNFNLNPGQSVDISVNSPLPPSKTLLTAYADPNLRIDEWNETDVDNSKTDNMCYDFQPVPHCGSNFWGRTYIVGQSTTLSVGLNVFHLYDASSVNVNFHVAGPGINVNQGNLGNALLQNATRNCQCPWFLALPEPFTFFEAGTYHFTITSDPDNIYDECDETNNVLEVDVTVIDGSDMRILSQFINPTPLNPGLEDTVSLVVSYENIGNTNVNDQMKLKVMVDEVFLDAVSPVPGLATGDHASITIPTIWKSDIPGAHIIRAIIDADHVIPETNENNNEATRAIIVGDCANLFFKLFEPSNSNPDIGDYIHINTKVGNDGATNALATVIFYYITDDEDTVSIWTSPISVFAHDSATITVPWTVLDTTTTLIAKIVNVNTLECNIDDNTATTPLGAYNVTISSTNSCSWGNNGTLTANPLGGTAPYIYTWNTGFIGQTLTGGPGNYTVTVTDNVGQSIVANGTINVYPAVVPAITGPGSICGIPSAGNTYQTEAGKVNYLWTITGGVITAGAGTRTITVNWTDEGVQTLTVTYTDEHGCTTTAPSVKLVHVFPTSVPTIAGPASVCENSTRNVYSTADGKTNYVWSVSAGGIITAGGGIADKNITLTWNTSGDKTVSVTYTDPSGCNADTTVYQVIVNPRPVVTLSGPQSVCVNAKGSIYTTDDGMSNYLWTVVGGDINRGGDSTDNSVTITWDVAGLETVSVNYTNAEGCTASEPTILPITVNALPVPTVDGPSSVCLYSTDNVYNTQGGMTNYRWHIEGGEISAVGTTTDSTVTINWNTLGDNIVQLNYTDANGCKGLLNTVYLVTVKSVPDVKVAGPSPVCQFVTGNVYTTQAGMSNYNWEAVGGTITTGGTEADSTATITWNEIGFQKVTVNYTNAEGCSALEHTIHMVNVKPSPIVTLDGPSTVCLNTSGNVYTTLDGKSNYVWSVSAGGTVTAGGTPNDNTVTITWSSAGDQTVSVNFSSPNGCTVAVPTVFNVRVNPLPVATISGDSPVCLNTPAHTYTTEAGMSAYVWNVSGGEITTGGTAADHTVTVQWTSAGQKTVSVNYTNSDACMAASPTTYSVIVNPLPVPTVSGPTPICLHSVGNVYTTQEGMSNYVWNVNGGVITDGGTGNDHTVTVRWNTAGVHTVSVNYTNANACTASAPTGFEVTVNPLPVPTVSGPSSVCLYSTGNVYSTQAGMSGYVWNVTGGVITAGGTAVDPTATITWNNAGTKSVSVNYANADGCMGDAATAFEVTVKPLPVPTVSGPSPVCLYSTGNVYSTQADMSDYVWTVVGGTITAGGTANDHTITVTWNTAGSRTVSVNYTGPNGCTGSSSTTFDVTVDPIPVPTITGPQSVCVNSIRIIYMTEPGMTNYTWQVPEGCIITAGGGLQDRTITVEWPIIGTQSVSVAYTNADGCMSSIPTTLHVTVSPTTVGGTTSGGDTIGLGDQTGILTLIGQTGSVTGWQKRKNGGNWTNMANFMTTCQDTPDSPGTWDYRAVVQSGACSSEFSGYTTVFVTAKKLTLKVMLEGLYNAQSGTMHKARNEAGDRFEGAVADHITVQLMQPETPFDAVATFIDQELMTDGTIHVDLPVAISGDYYIVVSHRNHLETWSAMPVSLSGSTEYSYDFSNSANKAFGDNMKNMGNATFGLFAGDVDQNGSVNNLDLNSVYNKASLFGNGYVVEDLNGDGVVDTLDLILLDNNAASFITLRRP